jgi:hypothetical protein
VSEPAGQSYDFFIAHAGPDKATAERLFGLLSNQTKVFLDSKSLLLGDDWDQVLPDAQGRSRVTVVLISANTDKAFYQREEIAAAIDMARSGEGHHRVVPIYLGARAPSGPTIPYGLRVKHGLTVSDQQDVQYVAARLLDLHRQLIPEATTDPERVATLEPDPGQELPELLDRLFSRDPVVSLPTMVRLTERGPAVLPDVVNRLSGLNKVNIATVRSLLGRFPEESTPLMVDRILQAHRNWQAATQVPDCFTPLHRPFAAEVLVGHLEHDEPDVVRKCIEALGFMAADTWGDRIVELLSTGGYYQEKYEYYVVLARARMLVFVEADAIDVQWRLPLAFSEVEALIRDVGKRGWQGLTYRHLQDVFARCQVRHADYLIGSWLTSDLPQLRALAASSLGQIRLHRALPYLVDRLKDEDEAVADAAAFALGNIGGASAVNALEEALGAQGRFGERSERLRWALARCVADAGDDEQFDRLSRDLLAHPPTEVCWVHRAIGLRRDSRFTSELRDGLQSTDLTVRGESALALARLEGAKVKDDLLRTYQEAATTMERVIASLALLVIDEAPPDDPELTQLRKELSTESLDYSPLIKDDILTVLRRSEHPQAAAIAEAWQGLYAENHQY